MTVSYLDSTVAGLLDLSEQSPGPLVLVLPRGLVYLTDEYSVDGGRIAGYTTDGEYVNVPADGALLLGSGLLVLRTQRDAQAAVKRDEDAVLEFQKSLYPEASTVGGIPPLSSKAYL